jgi:type I restriction enzyme, S subunit
VSAERPASRPTIAERFRRYPAYRDSGVEWLGEIPAGWEALALKRVVDPARPVTYGIVQCGPDHPDGVPYIRPVDMGDEVGIKVDTLQRTTPQIAAAYARSTIRPGDVVISIGPSFGKAMIVPTELDGANLTQGTARAAPGCRIASRFLFWALRSASTRQAWDSFSSGATFRALTLETLETCALALPALDEQHAIAAFLDRETARIDGLVAKKERLIELLQEQRTALITRAVTKGLDPNVPMKDSGVEWLGAIPAHWEVKRLKNVVPGVTVGIVVTPSKYYVDEGVPCLRSFNIAKGVVSMTDVVFISPSANELHRKSKVFRGDLLVVRTGKAGVAVIVPPELDGANCIDLLIIRRSKLVDSRFLYHFINSLATVRQVEARSVGAIQEHYNTGTLAELLLPGTSVPEQRAIAAFLDRETARIDALVSKVCEAIDRLKELRTALISAAVTGKIDVREEIA